MGIKYDLKLYAINQMRGKINVLSKKQKNEDKRKRRRQEKVEQDDNANNVGSYIKRARYSSISAKSSLDQKKARHKTGIPQSISAFTDRQYGGDHEYDEFLPVLNLHRREKRKRKFKIMYL